MKTRFAVLIALAVAACGGGSVDQKNLYSELYGALCANYAKCGVTTSKEACLALLGPTLGMTTTDPYAAQIAAGTIKYDGSAARRCIDAYASADCNTTFFTTNTASAECAKVYAGTLKVGDSCTGNDCVPDAFCSFSVDGKCPATCKARLATGGGPVTSTTQCQLGLVVSGNVCASPGAEGAACTGTAGSTFFSSCAGGLFCDATSKTCKKTPAKGEACTSMLPCGGYNQCLNGTCSLPGGTGAACGGSSSTIGLGCKLDLTCDVSKASPVCSERFDEGHACSGSGSGDCKAAFRCVAGQGTTATTCQKPGQEGAGCVSGSCDAKLYCETTSKQCKALLVGGSACTQFESCQDGFCSSNVCKNYSTTGTTCP
jgi:hypothetical protein